MIKVFYGEDRVRAGNEIQKFLGRDYEIIEGADLSPSDLPTLFTGSSLFATKRAILIRDALTNKSIHADLPKYLNSPHAIVLLELKIDKRSSLYKTLKSQIEFKEFALPENPNTKLVFDIYRTAKRDGQKAVKMTEQIQSTQDPIMFSGLLAAQILKDFQSRPSAKEKRTLRELSKLDLDLKSSTLPPWPLIQSFLLRLASWQT